MSLIELLVYRLDFFALITIGLFFYIVTYARANGNQSVLPWEILSDFKKITKQKSKKQHVVFYIFIVSSLFTVLLITAEFILSILE